ncbi:MAG TPA: tryptophan synthase subunit alpha [Terriglobia bacterium]|nr:tryptophan synthase subunit alpha [Terriglobia bacterium]
MTRIEKRFAQLKAEGRGAFIPYVTAGDPDLETTRKIVLALADAGADVIELGVPFSDPIADGPVIQRATERALRNHVRLRDVLRIGAEVRRESEVPLLLFSYTNPLLRYGLEKLAADAVASGFDGILATDLTVEESNEFRRIASDAGLNTVFLAAPTSSPERIRKIASVSTGFLYAVSRTGVTGERDELSADLSEFLDAVRLHTSTPIAVGFGISTPGHVRAVWKQAEGVVVGSAIVAEIEKNTGQPDIADRIRALASWLRGAA